ncbi:MAG: PfkB family carbohydrate kinase [Cytophagales bacterium]|nr:PfkB family carbohydrate kinase [Bernardetiaceae bacterium]MDW8206137.1 PfkB family carbohydrate kinase [Cytophagales bacterium]
MSLLAVGTVAFDSLETPFGKVDKVIGGSATYITLAASYFAPKVNLVAVVGYDFDHNDILNFQKHGINTEGLQIKQDKKSFFWAGRYHNDMNTRDTLVTELNVLEDFDPIIPESYQDCEVLMLGNLTPSIQTTVINRLKNRPQLIVMDTMNLWMNIAMDELRHTLTLVDVLSINDEEARQLSGEYSLRMAARRIHDMGPKYVIIKKGEHGALLFGEEKMFYAPALPLEEVFDPTGAGDSFAGGFTGYLAKIRDYSFESMKRGIIYGSAMASFCVEKFGPERLIGLSYSEIEERAAQFHDLVRIV